MKSATVFLVAVAVFASLLLESSSTPLLSSGSLLRDIVGKVGSAAESTVDGSLGIIGGVVGGVKDILGNVVGDVKDIVHIILEKAGIDIAYLVQGIGKVLGGVKVTLKNLLEKVATLEGQAKVELEQALNNVGTIVVKVEGLIEKILQAIEAGAVQEVEDLKAQLLAAVNELKPVVEGLFVLVDDLLVDASGDVATVLAGVKSLVAKIVKDLETVVSKVLNAAGALLGVVDKALQQLAYEKIQISEAALDKLIAGIEATLDKLTGAEKEAVSKILEQLLNFKKLCLSIHLSLKFAVDTGNNAALQAIVTIIKKAIVKINADLAEILKTLQGLIKTADQSVADILKQLVEDIKANLQLVIGDGSIVLNAIVKLLGTRGITVTVTIN